MSKPIISLTDDDLHDEQLDDIFFKDEKRSVAKKSEVKTTPKLKKKSSTPNEKPTKRPHGRPKIWTPEKIAEKKKENALRAKLKREQKKENLRRAQLAGDHPIGTEQRADIINQVIKSSEEVKNYLLNQKKLEDKSLNRSYVRCLYTKNPCKNHIYVLSHLDPITKESVAACKYCSRERKFTVPQWRAYFNKHKNKM